MVPDNYLEYINRNDVISLTADIRNRYIERGLSTSGIFSYLLSAQSLLLLLPSYAEKIEKHFPILESDIKTVQGRIDKAESRIKQYKRNIAILKGEEIPVDKIEQYEAEEKAKAEAAVNAEKQKNNVIVGVIILAIFAFIVYAVKKKQK
jgi:hypothetical protein